MRYNSKAANSRLPKKKGLFVLKLSIILLCLLPFQGQAHPSPNTILFLDVSPGLVTLEVQMPVPELELAFGHDISKDPETVVSRFGPQLKEYLLQHIHAYVNKGRPWKVDVVWLQMDKGTYVDNNIPYWEVNAKVVLTPMPGDATRHFFLDYDAVMHQVINHVALISIRSDWETGKVHTDSTEAGVIGRNLKDNTIPPLEVNLDKGSWWKGFQSMLGLGMQHIKEGTDHLLFLLALLLPAMLVIKGKNWNGFGGIKFSLLNIVKIVTAFTIGHSITLLLATLGWIRLPSQPVEILIAVSIFVSAIHALRPLFPGRESYIAAGFGLIHGLAFATVLSNLNLGAGTLTLSILGFNLGIEGAQLFMVAIVMPWLIILSKQSFYKYIRLGGALFAAIASVAWIIQRSINQPNAISTMVEAIALNGRWIILALALTALSTFFWKRSLKAIERKALVCEMEE